MQTHAVELIEQLEGAFLTGRRVWLDERLTALGRGGPKRDKVAIPDALRNALDYDPTPPIEVLAHLLPYDGEAAVSVAPAKSTDDDPVAEVSLAPRASREPARGLPRIER